MRMLHGGNRTSFISAILAQSKPQPGDAASTATRNGFGLHFTAAHTKTHAFQQIGNLRTSRWKLYTPPRRSGCNQRSLPMVTHRKRA